MEELFIVDVAGYQILYDGYYYDVEDSFSIDVELLKQAEETKQLESTDNPVKQRETGFKLEDAVTEIKVVHAFMGKELEWMITGIELEELKDWLSGLDYRKVEFEEENAPGNCEGGVYSFLWMPFSSDHSSEFTYVDNGEAECFLHIQGIWYEVLNPSKPPIKELILPTLLPFSYEEDAAIYKAGTPGVIHISLQM